MGRQTQIKTSNMKATAKAAQVKRKKGRMSPSALRSERDRARTVDLYLQGHTLHGVREMIQQEQDGRSIAVSTIHKWVHQANTVWREHQNEVVSNHKAIELAKINRLEVEYWNAWQNSRRNAIGTTKRKTATEVPGKKRPSLQLAEVIEQDKESAGDPRFLQGIQWCIEKRCELLGVEIPKPMETNMPIVHNTTVIRKMVINAVD